MKDAYAYASVAIRIRNAGREINMQSMSHTRKHAVNAEIELMLNLRPDKAVEEKIISKQNLINDMFIDFGKQDSFKSNTRWAYKEAREWVAIDILYSKGTVTEEERGDIVESILDCIRGKIDSAGRLKLPNPIPTPPSRISLYAQTFSGLLRGQQRTI